MIKIKVVIPNSGMDRNTLTAREEMLSHAVSKEIQISVDCIRRGPDAIESHTDEVLAAAEVIKDCIRAEEEGL